MMISWAHQVTQKSDSPESAEISYHVLNQASALSQQSVSLDHGLTAEQAAIRGQRFGLNELQEKAGRSQWAIFRDQFTNIMLVMLMVVAMVSALLDWQV